MSELPRDLASAPGPEVLPDAPEVTVAYTDFRRAEADDRAEGTRTASWPGGVSVAAARLDGVGPVELLELDDRTHTAGRSFLAAVQSWERVADHDHVAPIVCAGKRPRPWVATVATPTLAGAEDPPLDLVLWVGVCLADALGYAHDAGLYHGAVTPHRVRLHPSREWPFPRLDGFGLARVLAEDTGEVARAAPEQVGRERTIGAASDVYGLALTLYETLTGDLPYVIDGDPRGAVLGSAPLPPSTVEPTLPRRVDDLLLPALAKRPADRPTLEAFRDALVSLLLAEVGGSEGPARADPETADSFPFLDGDRADWRTDCPSCGRSVTNTLAAFRAHWCDAGRCDGPPEHPPRRASHSPAEWARVVESVRSATPTRSRKRAGGGTADHPLWTALAEERVIEVGGVAVASDDGTYPWLSYPRRGWRVPCPACGSTVFNAETAMKAHWSDAPGCAGPPDDFETA
jgi:hypothetical protein